MKGIDLGKDFNQREYWKYQLQILMGIYGALNRIAKSLEMTDEVIRVMEEEPDDQHR
jgi:hypothetical protein